MKSNPRTEPHPQLIHAHPGPGGVVLFMLLAAMGLFIAGLILPFTEVTKLWLFDNQISVLSGLVVLWKEGELFLFLILFVFTVCFPLVKICALLAIWLYPSLSAEQARTFYRFVLHMGKWSMLDVFIVAILVLTVKSGGLASIKVQSGFLLFFLSVIFTQVASLWTGKIARQLET